MWAPGPSVFPPKCKYRLRRRAPRLPPRTRRSLDWSSVSRVCCCHGSSGQVSSVRRHLSPCPRSDRFLFMRRVRHTLEIAGHPDVQRARGSSPRQRSRLWNHQLFEQHWSQQEIAGVEISISPTRSARRTCTGTLEPCSRSGSNIEWISSGCASHCGQSRSRKMTQ